MCGVVGFIGNDIITEEEKTDLLNIMKESNIRGVHAFGISYIEGSELITKKFSSFRRIKIPDTKLLIYHNRYATSGDYNNYTNNQPIEIGDISMCFNGVIDMGTKEEMEKRHGIEMESYNDLEVLIRKTNGDEEKILNFVSSMVGSFAGLGLSKNKLIALRNEKRPLHFIEKGGSTYIASTKDIISRVIDGDIKTFNPNEIYKWNI